MRPASRFRPWQRTWLEPPFNVAGLLLGLAMRLLPGAMRARAQVRVCAAMRGHPADPNPQLPLRQAETVQRLRSQAAASGRWPMLLVLTSHPETSGDRAWLRFELLRQGLEIAAAAALAGPPPHEPPQCLLAIDPFALDSVLVPVQAMYAGLIHAQYLAWDRQPSTQSSLQRSWLLRDSGSRIAARFLAALRRNPVVMAMPGGVPVNARLLYAAREWAARLPLQKGVRRSAFKHAVLRALTRPENQEMPPATGTLGEETRERLRRLLTTQSALQAGAADQALADLAEEFRFEVPRRRRLFRVLQWHGRRSGRALVVLPIAHRSGERPVDIGEPVCLSPESGEDAWDHQIHRHFLLENRAPAR